MLFPTDPTGCSDYYTQNALNVSTFVTADGNCSHFQKLQKAYSAHAKQVVILSNTGSTDVCVCFFLYLLLPYYPLTA